MAKFVDKFGNRLSGSQTLEDAIDYMVDLSDSNGLEDVHTEDVEVQSSFFKGINNFIKSFLFLCECVSEPPAIISIQCFLGFMPHILIPRPFLRVLFPQQPCRYYGTDLFVDKLGLRRST